MRSNEVTNSSERSEAVNKIEGRDQVWLTFDERRLLRKAAALVAEGVEEYSCIAITEAAYREARACKSEDFLMRRANARYYEHIALKLQKMYADFYGKDRNMPWFSRNGEIPRNTRVLLLLTFAEVG